MKAGEIRLEERFLLSQVLPCWHNLHVPFVIKLGLRPPAIELCKADVCDAKNLHWSCKLELDGSSPGSRAFIGHSSFCDSTSNLREQLWGTVCSFHSVHIRYILRISIHIVFLEACWKREAHPASHHLYFLCVETVALIAWLKCGSSSKLS